MRPTLKVWCLSEMREKELKALFKKLLEAMKSVHKLEIRSADDVTILFPSDRMKWGLGLDIIAEISDLPYDIGEERRDACSKIAETLKKEFPNAYVKCRAERPDPYTEVCEIE